MNNHRCLLAVVHRKKCNKKNLLISTNLLTIQCTKVLTQRTFSNPNQFMCIYICVHVLTFNLNLHTYDILPARNFEIKA